MDRYKFFPLIFLLILGFSSCVSGYRHAPELVVPVIAQVRFDTAVVERGDVSEMEFRMGIVRIESVPLNFGATSASFLSFYVSHGDVVEYGQLLAVLNMEPLRRQIEQHEERIEQLRRNFAFENELRRIDIDLYTIRGDLQAASLGRLELQLAIERQELQLRHEDTDLALLRARFNESLLPAPFNGTIAYIPRRLPGSWVAPFDPVIYIIPEAARIFVEYTGNTHIRQIVSSRIYAHINGEEFLASRKRLTREQTLRYATPPARFLLESQTGAVPDVGALASLITHIRSAEDVLRLPRNTIFYSPDIGHYVHVVTNGQLELTPITIGITTETYVEIRYGLAEGVEVYVRS